MTSTLLMDIALLLPFAGAVAIWLAGRWPNLREAVTLVTAGALFAVVITLLARVLGGERPEIHPVQLFPGVEIDFVLEPLGMLFATVASTLWIVNSIYSIGYMRGNDEPRQTPFYICFAIAIGGAIGVAFAGNLLTLFLYYELLTISTYPLVTHKGNDEAKAKGRVYLLLLMGTSMVFLLPAIIWVLAAAGTTEFTAGGLLSGTGMPTWQVSLLLALFIFGIGKAAVMPVHFWLPAAMVAPTPVSALLHAVAVVKAGVFSVVKVVVYVFGVDYLSSSGAGAWLTYAAGFTVVCASVIALMQDNLKKRLAYSTVSQLSYVVLATAILTPISVMGAMLHIAAHAVSKITLFFAAGSIYTAAHKTEISQLDGIGRLMPWTMGAFAVGALSMIGVPPTAGFVSKWFMLQGGMAAENWVAIGVIFLSTVLNAAYFLPIVYRAFWRAPPPADAHHPHHGEGPAPVVLALTITALGTLALFFFPDVPLGLAEAMIADQPVPAPEPTALTEVTK
ncbi:monovalent cation/H+ antiporter subunit D family protein [Limibaculum sp. FT325]|uniref:monovalent cation/H+ antiporter subunit D family protein n=1 Tax=Thermohalobaculum sediminis TaxID=2939436 RepID=UPI0020BDD3B0|nr:monovalent cation/H+ antiporter subunit D family protein [Limibaculum sediminis]MCL5778881.1 monovalent cation/H+ antiporter subunit D family protein [Limibaculum sediminis]